MVPGIGISPSLFPSFTILFLTPTSTSIISLSGSTGTASAAADDGTVLIYLFYFDNFWDFFPVLFYFSASILFDRCEIYDCRCLLYIHCMLFLFCCGESVKGVEGSRDRERKEVEREREREKRARWRARNQVFGVRDFLEISSIN